MGRHGSSSKKRRFTIASIGKRFIKTFAEVITKDEYQQNKNTVFPVISYYEWTQRFNREEKEEQEEDEGAGEGNGSVQLKVHDVFVGFTDEYSLKRAIQVGLDLPQEQGVGIMVGTEEVFYRNYDLYLGAVQQWRKINGLAGKTPRNINTNELLWYRRDISKTMNFIKSYKFTVHRNIRGLPLMSVIKTKRNFDMLHGRVLEVLRDLAEFYPRYMIEIVPMKKRKVAEAKRTDPGKSGTPSLRDIVYAKETGSETYDRYRKYEYIRIHQVKEFQERGAASSEEIQIVDATWDVVINEREHLKITTTTSKHFDVAFHSTHKLIACLSKALKRSERGLSIWREDEMGYIAVDPRNIGSLFECELDLHFDRAFHYSSSEVIDYLRHKFNQSVNFDVEVTRDKDIHRFRLPYQPDLSEVESVNKFKPIVYVMARVYIHASTQTRLVHTLSISEFLDAVMDMGNIAKFFQESSK